MIREWPEHYVLQRYQGLVWRMPGPSKWLPISTIVPRDVAHLGVNICVLECFGRTRHHRYGTAVRTPRCRLLTGYRNTALLCVHVILVVLPEPYPHQQKCADRQYVALKPGARIWRRALLKLVHGSVLHDDNVWARRGAHAQHCEPIHHTQRPTVWTSKWGDCPRRRSRSKSMQCRPDWNAFLPRLKLALYLFPVPGHNPGSRDQQRDARQTDQYLNDDTVGDLDQDDMSGK